MHESNSFAILMNTNNFYLVWLFNIIQTIECRCHIEILPTAFDISQPISFPRHLFPSLLCDRNVEVGLFHSVVMVVLNTQDLFKSK